MVVLPNMILCLGKGPWQKQVFDGRPVHMNHRRLCHVLAIAQRPHFWPDMHAVCFVQSGNSERATCVKVVSHIKTKRMAKQASVSGVVVTYQIVLGPYQKRTAEMWRPSIMWFSGVLQTLFSPALSLQEEFLDLNNGMCKQSCLRPTMCTMLAVTCVYPLAHSAACELANPSAGKLWSSIERGVVGEGGHLCVQHSLGIVFSLQRSRRGTHSCQRKQAREGTRLRWHCGRLSF